MRAWAIAFGALLLAACGGSTSSDGASDAAAPEPPGRAQASIGPIDVSAGGEETVCIFKRLDNDEDLMATSFVADLAPGSHHLIVYRSTATEENLEPTSCLPFVGLIDKTAVPIVLVNKPHLEYSFPPNVGVVLPAHQMLKIEAHYINPGAADIQGSGTVVVHGQPLAQAAGYQAADFGFWGTTKFDIPPMASASTPVLYTSGIAGTNVFAVTTHQHRLGTRFQVWQAHKTDAPDGGSPDGGAAASFAEDAQIVDERDWSNPALVTFDPPFSFDGTNGLAFQCDWSNTTDQDVSFGESALNEMCFLGVYYFPSHGFDLCIDRHCSRR